jgi:type II secretory pathway pseudopilin PulG
LWASLALLAAWHDGIALQQQLPPRVIAALALDGILFGGLLILSAYALRLVEDQRRLTAQRAVAEERLRSVTLVTLNWRRRWLFHIDHPHLHTRNPSGTLPRLCSIGGRQAWSAPNTR